MGTAVKFESPYSVVKAFKKSDAELTAQSEFRGQLSSDVEPLLAEVVSGETRRLQQLLFITGSLLLLMSLSIVEVSETFEWNGIKLKMLTDSTFTITVVAGIYLEMIVAIRSQPDWRAWKVESCDTARRAPAPTCALRAVNTPMTAPPLNKADHGETRTRSLIERRPRQLSFAVGLM